MLLETEESRASCYTTGEHDRFFRCHFQVTVASTLNEEIQQYTIYSRKQRYKCMNITILQFSQISVNIWSNERFEDIDEWQHSRVTFLFKISHVWSFLYAEAWKSCRNAVRNAWIKTKFQWARIHPFFHNRCYSLDMFLAIANK